MTKLVLSPEVVDLESRETKLSYENHYEESRELDPVFADVMDSFQDQLAASHKDYFGGILVRNHAEEERLYINLEKATEVLNKAMLTVYYLLQTQAEINEIEPGAKSKGKKS
jgi:hypothetical protein